MDHVAALPLFKKAKVYLPKEEEKMLTGEEQKIIGYSNSMSAKNYILLNDQQTVNVGGVKIFCVLTAGHTSSSMCYQINDKNLFTSDILIILYYFLIWKVCFTIGLVSIMSYLFINSCMILGIFEKPNNLI